MGKIAKVNDKQTPARQTRWLSMFIGKTSQEELNEIFHIGTSEVENKNYSNRYCKCDEPKPVGVEMARYCWECKKDIK